jgi:hypothetical protein
MAIKATVFKANLQIADMERHYYHDHALTLARHPSETDERMMVRLLAFALHAHEYLELMSAFLTKNSSAKPAVAPIKSWFIATAVALPICGLPKMPANSLARKISP